MRIRKKLVGFSLLQLVAIIAAVLFPYYLDAKDKIQERYIHFARAVVTTTESARESMAENWHNGLVTTDVLQRWAQEGQVDRIVSLVPGITAFRKAMAKADEGGYEFRVPNHRSRDPGDEPDPFEARVLDKIKSENLDEYYEIDGATNTIRYFRPIRLTQECMLCHSDPATSGKLWGNDQGLDPTGIRMEGWKVGEVHGAFEVMQSLEAADRELSSTVWKGIALVMALGLSSMVLFVAFINRTIPRPLAGVMTAIS